MRMSRNMYPWRLQHLKNPEKNVMEMLEIDDNYIVLCRNR